VDLVRDAWLRLVSLPRAVALFGVLAGLLLAVQSVRGVGLGIVVASGMLTAWHTRFRLRRFLEEHRDSYRFAARADELVHRFRARFADRGDPLTVADLKLYERAVVNLRPLLAHYDLIQGYAVDPIYPLLGATRPFVSYEHGTLRDIPSEPTARGRITALAYAEANAIYMTNADSVPQTLQLQPDRRRVVFGIHGFDERRLRDWAATQDRGEITSQRFGVNRSTTLFFAPARHDHAIKGNDRVIRALPLIADRCPDAFRVVFVRWGQEVDRSEQLLAELGVGDHVVWIDPLPKRELWRAYCSANAVLDQFVLPCFGGVTIEALALGVCPVLTHIDTDVMREFYGAPPPLFSCSSPEEIACAMDTVIREPDRAREVAARSRRWLDESHSHRVVARTHLDLYETAGLFAADGDATSPAL
jgi:glycosyltransferase involved in cell wall biosynthesis